MDVTHELDVDRYYALPRELRAEMDAWLKAENLTHERIVWFRLLEGAIEADRYASDENGVLRVALNEAGAPRCERGEWVPAVERVTFPVSSPPPRLALS